ncbi:hypothetical protein [Chitinophaga solisilvae]|uniref:hypothetical protein n=1 Tax=Chitinophaga solisilvae TaxID=1233460 RepID=UPI0013697803|nr:hypothetical protein [Chitinophaga solisilvae]
MNTPVIVPMELDVLLANGALTNRDQFRLWRYSYPSMSFLNWAFPEPDGFDGNIDLPGTGAYLHWTLPRSLRVGQAGSTSDFPLIPNRWLIVRIYRDTNGKNVQRSWILEADCPNQVSGDPNACYFIVSDEVKNNWTASSDPNRNSVRPTPFDIPDNSGTNSYYINMGRAFDMPSWQEADPQLMFITSLGPGNTDFSGYIQFNTGVLSFYDNLTDVPDTTALSYMVTGWYANSNNDILVTGSSGFTGEATADEVLAALNWQVAQEQSAGSSNITLYSGRSFNLPWDKNASQPPANDELENIRSTLDVSVCVANTGLEAFSTLVATHLEHMPGYTDPQQTIELLRAFQFDMLPELNNINGRQLVDEKIQQAWFNASFGGNRWQIVPDSQHQQASGDSISAADAAWLQQLNTAQQSLDDALTLLFSLQWDLNAIWWKYHYLHAPLNHQESERIGITADQLAALLDPDNTGSTLGKVLAQLKIVNDLLPQVPQPQPGIANAQQALQAGINAFAQSKHISQGYVLKAVAQPRYWLPDNPSLLISGISPDPLVNPDTALEVRLPSQLIKSFTVASQQITAAALSSMIPALANTQVLPVNVLDIYTEFFLLDPANAAQIATITGLSQSDVYNVMKAHQTTGYNDGILPDADLSEWQQKWQPAFMEWELMHTPVPFAWKINPEDQQSTPNWIFNGTDYEMINNPQGVTVVTSPSDLATPYTLSGRASLSTHTQMTFGARLKAFAQQYGNSNLSDLWKQIDNTDHWRFLSQELTNTNDYLTQRDRRLYRKPAFESFSYQKQQLTYSKIIGYDDDTSLYPFDTPSFAQGLVNSIPAIRKGGPSYYPFHQIRGGEFYLRKLTIYDKFGRRLDLVVPDGVLGAANFPLMVDGAFGVTHQLSAGIKAPFQVPPRILQPARLNMLLADYRNKTNILGIAAGVNPVCGWVVANHTDHSLLLFFPDGSNAGEVLVMAGTSGTHVQWTPPPHNNVNNLGDVTSRSVQLGSFATALTAKSPAAFQAFLKAIDSTLWTVDPLGKRTNQDLSFFIGRPLALVALTLQLKLHGQPLQSQDWPSPMAAANSNAHVPAIGDCVFDVRFGDQASREDGVIGYFEEENYDLFNCVVQPDDSGNYLQQIGPLNTDNGNYIRLSFGDNNPKYITLLADPRASIHAFTGILPIKEVQLPEEFVDKPLSALDITFRAGPVLSAVQPSDSANGVPAYANALTYLPVSARFGAWTWWESTVANPGTASASFSWQGFTLTKATTTANFDQYQASLHDGYLQFITNQQP